MGIFRTDICTTIVDTPQGDEEVECRCTMPVPKAGSDQGQNGGEELMERGQGGNEALGSPQSFQLTLEAGFPGMSSQPDSFPSSLPSSCINDACGDSGIGNAAAPAAEASANPASRANGITIAHHPDLTDVDRVDSRQDERSQTGQECQRHAEQAVTSRLAGTLPLSSEMSPSSSPPAGCSLLSSGCLPGQLPSSLPARSPPSNGPSSPPKPKRSTFKFSFPKPMSSGPQNDASPCSAATGTGGTITALPSARRGSSALFPSSPRPDEGKRVRKDGDESGSYPERVNPTYHHGSRVTLSSCATPSQVNVANIECCDQGSRATFQMASPSYPSPSLPPSAPSFPSSSEGAANLFPSMRSNSGLTNEKMVYELLHNPDWQFPAGPARSGVQGSRPNAAGGRTGDVGPASSISFSSSSRSSPAKLNDGSAMEGSSSNISKSPGVRGARGAGDGPKLLIAGTFPELRATVRQIMEDAFWDSLHFHLLSNPPDFSQVVKLVEEIREELLSLASERMKDEIHSKMDTNILMELLNSAGLNFGYMRGLLDYVADLMLKLGAPARDNESRSEHQRLLGELSVSADLAASPKDGKTENASTEKQKAAAKKAFADAVVNGFRFVFDRLQVLKLDISNARLRAVSRVINSAAGVGYLRMQFAKQHGLPGLDDEGGTALADNSALPVFDALFDQQPSILEWMPRNDQRGQIRSRLVRTCQWMAEIAQEVVQLREEVNGTITAVAAARGNGEATDREPSGAGGTGGSNNSAHHQGSQSSSPMLLNIPTAMRTGVRGLVKDPSFTSCPGSLCAYADSLETGLLDAKSGSSSCGGGSSTGRSAVQWQSVETLVRVGIGMIVRGAEGAEGGRLAETLRLEVGRIRNLQDQFQRALVTAAGLLMAQQVLASRGFSGVSMSAILSRGKAEMLRILDDPMASVDKIGALLGDLVIAASEEASWMGAQSSRPTAGQGMVGVAAEAEMMTRMLARALQPDDVVFKRMVVAISTAIRWLVLLDGPKQGLAHLPAANALQRAGATLLMDKVEELAAGVRKIAKVNALVYQPWYCVCMPGA